MSDTITNITYSNNGKLYAGMTKESIRADINAMTFTSEAEREKAYNKQIELFDYANSLVEGEVDDVISEREIEAYNKKEKTKKTWKTIGLVALGVGLTAVTTLLFRNKNSVVNVERHFKRLYDDIPKSQETLKKVFMNENLTTEETMEILKRYEQIEQSSFNMTKEEYVTALFNEAKNNFNLRNNVTLEFGKLGKKTRGEYSFDKKTITIDSRKVSRTELFENIHHELRHAYQDEAMENYRKAGFKIFNYSPQEIEYCEKMCNAKQNYVDFKENPKLYRKNFLELDANDTAFNIWRLIKLRTISERFSNNIFELFHM